MFPVVDVFLRGGWVMWPILLGSLIALALFVERVLTLRKSRQVPDAFFQRVEALLKEGRIEGALAACEENPSALAAVAASVLRQATKVRHQNPAAPIVIDREVVEMVGRAEVAGFEQYLPAIGLIASIEPLLGLFGTVLGLIESFQKIEATETMGSPSIVAGGVWTALITTAGGLIVAIPAYVMHRYLVQRTRSLTLALEERVQFIVKTVEALPPSPVAVTVPAEVVAPSTSGVEGTK